MDFKSVNGINLAFLAEEHQLPQMLEAMHFESMFLNNFNIMYIALAAEAVLSAIGFAICKMIGNKTGKAISKRFLKEGTLTLMIFSSFNIAFSAGVHWNYADPSNPYYTLNTAFLYSAVALMLLMMGFLEFSSRGTYGEFKDKFKRDFGSTIYISMSLLYRMGLGIYVSINNEYELGALIAISFSMVFLLYNFTNLPFCSALYNYRANAIHVTQFIILMTANYYRSMKSTTSIDIKGRIYEPAILVLVSIGVCALLSFLLLIYELVKLVQQCGASLQKMRVSNNETVEHTRENMDIA